MISSGDELTRLTLNIIIGMLKIIIIKLPMAKFFLFNKYIDPEIEAIQVIIGEPIKKLKKIIFILDISILSKRQAMGYNVEQDCHGWLNFLFGTFHTESCSLYVSCLTAVTCAYSL